MDKMMVRCCKFWCAHYMVNSIDKSYEPSYTDTQHIYSIVFWWYKRGDFDDYSLSGISIHKHNRLSSTPARRRSRVSSLSPEAHDTRRKRRAAIRFHGHATPISSSGHNGDTAVLCSTRKMNASRPRDVTATPAYHLNQRSPRVPAPRR